MSKFTDFLNLFMWDSIEDSEEEFNIDKALNDNWKKIDTKVKTHVTSVNEEINNFKEETNQKIENIQALPVGGTKGQVLTKQSETNGDANWEDIEANEVFVGNEKEAPSSAKIIVEEDDFVEGSTLGKAEVYVGAEEPTAGEKVWFRKGKNVFNAYSSDISYYLRNTDKEKYTINNSNSIKVEGTGVSWNRLEITISNLKANTKYTINSIVTNTTQGYAGLLCDYGNNSVQYVSNKEKFNAKITIVTDENGKVKLQFYTNYSSTTQNSSAIFSEIQLEEGEEATTYEAYIEPQIYARNSNGVYEEFTKKSEEGLVDYKKYIEFNDKVTTINACVAYKKDNLLFLMFDLKGTFSEGETVIGTLKTKLKTTAFGSGRLSISDVKLVPATYIAISNGVIRVHSTAAGIATAGNIIMALDE